jgi:hypothetical protein
MVLLCDALMSTIRLLLPPPPLLLLHLICWSS